MTGSSDLVFFDTETLGLGVDDPVWEVAAIRQHRDGAQTAMHLFVDHDGSRAAETLPEPFLTDYRARYRRDAARPEPVVVQELVRLFEGRPHIVGAVPSFDSERIARLLRRHGQEAPWHYHLVDVETFTAGLLGLAPPWRSDDLSRAVGVDPTTFARHTAMGDVLWAQTMWRAALGWPRPGE